MFEVVIGISIALAIVAAAVLVSDIRWHRSLVELQEAEQRALQKLARPRAL